MAFFDVNDLSTQRLFNETIEKLTSFYKSKGFLEVYGQGHLSILAACEDPSTIGTFNYTGKVWPLPQTNQMNLETIILKNPELPGVFVNTTSYRQEANPIAGRHNLIFPMSEFEFHGTLEDLIQFEIELLDYLGIKDLGGYPRNTYKKTVELLGKTDGYELKSSDEEEIWKKFGKAYFLTDFPEHTSPFWNMRRNSDGLTAKKCDVILFGQETIGSAEREVDPNIMLDRFNTISDGKYADLLYAQFGRARVMAELGEYLDLNFFPRVGAGIGVTRMMRAIQLNKK